MIVDEGEVTLFSALDARSTSVAQRCRKRKRPAPESDPEGRGELSDMADSRAEYTGQIVRDAPRYALECGS